MPTHKEFFLTLKRTHKHDIEVAVSNFIFQRSWQQARYISLRQQSVVYVEFVLRPNPL
jgi:hypothetical protein